MPYRSHQKRSRSKIARVPEISQSSTQCLTNTASSPMGRREDTPATNPTMLGLAGFHDTDGRDRRRPELNRTWPSNGERPLPADDGIVAISVRVAPAMWRIERSQSNAELMSILFLDQQIHRLRHRNHQGRLAFRYFNLISNARQAAPMIHICRKRSGGENTGT